MTLAQLRAQVRAAILLNWIEHWRGVHHRNPGPHVRARMDELLRQAARPSRRLKVSSGTALDAQFSAVFPQGLPDLELVRELELAHPRVIDKVRSKLGIVGESSALQQSLKIAACFSESAAPVLLLGETGTGKELMARFIHEISPRAAQPFITLNCAAVSDALVVAELFGYDPGAFTGAAPRGRIGKAEAAHGGTMFLDEIGELSPAAQSALLRFVDTGEIQKVGRVRPQCVDVRLVAATHRDLPAMVKHGTFRADLYYRIALLPVELPPLRARPRDLPQLIQHFLEENARELRHRRPLGISAAAVKELSARAWPGNLRELKHTIARAMLLAQGQTIEVQHLAAREHILAPFSTLPDQNSMLRAALSNLRLPLFRALDEWVSFLTARGNSEFSNRDVTITFGCSDSAARIRLAALVTNGILLASGAKKGRRYRLAKRLSVA